jgi:DNA-binding PadR family transcriptional regulator
MIEILILYILYNEKNTLYGIRKVIKDKFLYLTSATFGSIHPAVSRLIEKGFVQEKKTVTEGGRKKHIYAITKDGKHHLILMLKADFSFNSNNIEKQIGIKLACSDVLDDSSVKLLYANVVRYYEQRIMLFSKMLSKANFNDLQANQVKNLISAYDNEINFLKIK